MNLNINMEPRNFYEFETMLQDLFWGDIADVRDDVAKKIETDQEFAEQYEEWLEYNFYDSWEDFYNELQDEAEASRDMMFPNDD